MPACAEYVQGMQGDHEKYVQVISSPKHFDAYGGEVKTALFVLLFY